MSKIDECPKCGKRLAAFIGTGGNMPEHVADWVGLTCTAKGCRYLLGMGTVMRRLARASKNLIVEVANALPGLPQSDVPEDAQERMRTRTQAGKAARTSKTQVSGPLPPPRSRARDANRTARAGAD